MNVIITNQQENLLSSLNVEVIKALHGTFNSDELIGTFSNFFFARMILDVTALKDSNSIVEYQKLSIGLPVDKIILLLPAGSEMAGGAFLSKLISLGYYNFTSNVEGVQYLLSNPNSYKDVAHLHTFDSGAVVQQNANGQTVAVGGKIVGFKNLTDHAGASTLVYMMKRELDELGVSVLAVEVDKRDFMYFNDKTLLTCTKTTIAAELLKAKNYSVVLVDLNDGDENMCDEVVYLLETSIIKLNKLLLRDKGVFRKMVGKKVIMNKCILSAQDISDFQIEAGINLFYIMPPLNDRNRSQEIGELLAKLGIISTPNG